jgi:hypothetical protein
MILPRKTFHNWIENLWTSILIDIMRKLIKKVELRASHNR